MVFSRPLFLSTSLVPTLISLLSLSSRPAVAQDCSADLLPEASFQCPATGVLPHGPGASSSHALAREWTDLHNKYRCMHNYPALVWLPALVEKADSQHHHKTAMEHSTEEERDYSEYAHGENLSWAEKSETKGQTKFVDGKAVEGGSSSSEGTETKEGSVNPAVSVKGWYDEIADCLDWSVGCKQEHPVTGHFTAMMWKGATGLGCGISASNSIGYCHYRAGKKLPPTPDTWCHIPNFGTNYSGMIGKPISSRGYHDEATCEALAKSCGDIDVGPGPLAGSSCESCTFSTFLFVGVGLALAGYSNRASTEGLAGLVVGKGWEVFEKAKELAGPGAEGGKKTE